MIMELHTLQTFIHVWKELSRKKNATVQQTELVDGSGWNHFFFVFSEALETSTASGNYIDLFAIDDIGRREMRYSAVLAWLLNASADHGQGRVFLDGFLEYVHRTFPDEKPLDFTGYYEVVTEAAPDQQNRLDILIEGRSSLMVIEVKVDAREHRNQLGRYERWLEQQPGASGQLFYLTRSGTKGSSDRALPIRWRDVADCLLDTLKRREKGSSVFLHSVADIFIRQYCERISHL